MVIVKMPFPFSSSAAVVAFEDDAMGESADSTSSSPSRSLSTSTWTWDWRSGVRPRPSEQHQPGAHPLLQPGAGRDASTSPPRRKRRSRAAGTGRPARWREGNISFAQRVKEVAVLYMVRRDLAGQFHAQKMGYHDEMLLLRSRAPLRWSCGTADYYNTRISSPVSSMAEIFSTGSIGPLSGGRYYLDFIPYVSSYTNIFSTVPRRKNGLHRRDGPALLPGCR